MYCSAVEAPITKLRSTCGCDVAGPQLSVVIPAHNEAGSIRDTVDEIARRSSERRSTTRSSSSTTRALTAPPTSSALSPPTIHASATTCSHNPRGFGFAVRAGLDLFQGDVVAIVMADGSDDPADLVRYLEVIEEGYDCAFGSRFVRGSSVHDYPKVKLGLNRIVNFGIRVLFRSGYNDTTNAFKAYRREVIDTVQPLLSNHFNLTVEIPLKAIVRGHSYKVVPISLAQPQGGRVEAVPSGDGEPVRVHRALRAARAAPESRRLQEVGNRDAWRSVARRRSKALRPEMTSAEVGRRRVRDRRAAVRARVPAAVHRSAKAFEMDEGAVNAYAVRVLDGAVPHRDFLTFYGPGNLWLVAGAFEVFGESVGVSARWGSCIACSSSCRCSCSDRGSAASRRRARGRRGHHDHGRRSHLGVRDVRGARVRASRARASGAGRRGGAVDGLRRGSGRRGSSRAGRRARSGSTSASRSCSGRFRFWRSCSGAAGWCRGGLLAALAIYAVHLAIVGPERIQRVVEDLLAAGPGRYLQSADHLGLPGQSARRRRSRAAALARGGSVSRLAQPARSRRARPLRRALFSLALLPLTISRDGPAHIRPYAIVPLSLLPALVLLVVRAVCASAGRASSRRLRSRRSRLGCGSTTVTTRSTTSRPAA